MDADRFWEEKGQGKAFQGGGQRKEESYVFICLSVLFWNLGKSLKIGMMCFFFVLQDDLKLRVT